jgi:acetolactate synthase-1/2/3 large subunit
MKNPQFESIASAYGIPFRCVAETNQVEAALTEAAEHKGAYMVEFLCDPSEIVLPMVPSGGSIADMIVSVPPKDKS